VTFRQPSIYGRELAPSRRHTSELCMKCPRKGGNRKRWVPTAPAASCAKVESTRVSSPQAHRNTRRFLRDGLSAYFALSPVTGLSCHRRSQNEFRQLDASVGASGPHDFAVRKSALSSAAPLASIASPPYVRDDRETPLLCGPGWRGICR
jgi:hypothetical protein